MNQNRRQAAFDRHRNLPHRIMDAQQLQEMIQQHQREIQALRQQLEQPQRMFDLTADQIIKQFHNIKTFTGTGEYKLQEFINAVENTSTLCANNEALLRHGLRIILTEKLQGNAKRCIQRLGNDLTWEQIRAELKSEFKPRKNYKRLMDESRNIKVSTLRELFKIIRNINFQLNEVFEFDDNQPTNYSPSNNDKNLVDIVKDMLTGSYRVYIRPNMTLNDVFNVFDEMCLLDESDVIHYNFKKYKDHKNNNSFRPNFKPQGNTRGENSFGTRSNNQTNQQSHNSANFRRNDDYSGQNRNFRHNNNNSGQFRQNSGQYRQSSIQQRQFNNRNFFSNSGQFRQRPNNEHSNNNDRPEPMEIDNIQQDVNFTEEPRDETYQ